MVNREGLIKRISNYLMEEMREYGSCTDVYQILAKAFVEAITKSLNDLNEFWLGHISEEIYQVTLDPRGKGDDAYCYQIEQEFGEALGIEPFIRKGSSY